MKYSIINPSEIHFSDFSFWQSPEWKKILQNSRQAKEVFYFWNLKWTVFLVEIRSLWAGFLGAFCLWIQKNQIDNDFDKFFENLQYFVKSRWAIFLQIEPLDDFFVQQNITGKTAIKKFIPPFTRQIALTDDLDTILAKMPSKGRYEIKNASKKWVEVEIITDFSDEILDIWMQLLDETTSRDAFAHNSRIYYESFLRENPGKVFIAAAKWQGKYIAMTISILTGNLGLYYYGASTSDKEARKLASTYLTIWKSMEFCKNNDKKVYDLFGIADPSNPKDPLINVSNFKQKFGGEVVVLPTKFLVPVSPKYHFYKMLVRIKKLFL